MKITQFGNPILRESAKKLTISEIRKPHTQQIIKQMQEYLANKELGVGLAAPQIGKSLSISVIQIRPTKNRIDARRFDLVIINPIITDTFGRRSQLYEGCISAGPLKSSLFAKVPRYKKIKLKYIDENGKSQNKIFEGLPAHVIQHEVDHLYGILFVDKVRDTKSYISYAEYIKLIKLKQSENN